MCIYLHLFNAIKYQLLYATFQVLSTIQQQSTIKKIMNHFNQQQHQPKYTTKNKIQQSCLQCASIHPLNLLNYMAQFNAYVCKICYQQSIQMMIQYKNARTKLYSQYDQIQQGLYLGNEDAAIDSKTFQNTKINAIFACGSHLMTPFEEKYQYKKFKIADCPSEKILHLFQQAYQWIMKMKTQNRHVLIHCAAGVSRSASFVIAYIMRSRNWTYEQSHKFVKSKRSIIYPNSGFIQQLKEYQKVVKQKIQANQQI